MLKGKSLCLWFSAMLLFISAVPSRANDIVSASASVNATCTSYTGTATVTNLTIGHNYAVDWTINFTPPSGPATTATYEQDFTGTQTTQITLPSFTNSIGPLSGTFTLSGTATLVNLTTSTTQNTVNITFTTPTLSCPVPPPPPGDQGCTPGYWKNHTTKWVGYTTGETVGSVFTGASPYDGDTLLAALSLQGGSGVDGAKQILIRAAVSALLNSSAVGYPLTTSQVISMTDTALASGDRATILTLASQLDADNNLGCPLN